jgi:glycosyl transferase family 25
MISKIYYINLDRRPDRDNNVKTELGKINYNGPVERISAVDGRKLIIKDLLDELITSEGKNDALNKNAGLYYIMTPGAIGCALSHRNLATKIIEEMSDNNYVLILEDDVVLEDDFMNKLNKYIKDMPKFDMLFIGYHMKQNKMVGDSFYDKPLKLWGLFGYIINKKGASELLKLFPLKYQIDTEMHKLYNNNNLEIYSLKENNRLVKSPQSQEDSQYGTDIQLREYPELETFTNIINNNNDLYILIFLLVILVTIHFF